MQLPDSEHLRCDTTAEYFWDAYNCSYIAISTQQLTGQ